MSKSIDYSRRKVICATSLIGLTLFLSPKVGADDITDLIKNKDETQIIAVRIWPSSIYTRITIESSTALDIDAINNSNDRELHFNILNVHLNSILNSMANKVISEDPIISNIKVKQINPSTVGITIILKQQVRVQTRVLVPVKLGTVNYKYRFVLDMYLVSDTSKGELNDDILALLQLNGVDNTSVSYNTQETLVSKRKISKRFLVMIDPGHGGEDPGAIGPTGIKEKDVVLDIGQRLYTLINQSGNMQAMLTRNQDIFVPLGTRVKIARKAKADIFVSIHADAFTTPLAKGASVFILSDRGASSANAKWLATTQNNADLIGGMSFKSKDQLVSKILLEMTQTWSMQKSKKLGQILLGKLSVVGKLHNNYVEKAGFAVLKAPDIPSVLVETAFISNKDEETLLKNPDFRQKMANAILNGLNSFLNKI